jgi:hypothetical protein
VVTKVVTSQDSNQQMTAIPPKVFHDLVNAWRNGADQIPKLVNGTFRGITNAMPGYWTVVGITRKALEEMASSGWRSAAGLRRDHIKSGRDFQQRLLDHAVTYDEFCDLVADYGRCIVCTKAENPARTAGYGNAYHDADIRWLSRPVDTSTSMTVPTTRVMTDLFRSANSGAA